MGRDPDGGWDDEKERRDQASAETPRRAEMTDIDVSKIKVGDVVGVRVVNTNSEEVLLPSGGWISSSDIVSHTPAPKPALKVGDRVWDEFLSRDRIVIWIENETAWLSPIAGTCSLPGLPLSEVETWDRRS